MRIQQLSVFLENREGRLDEVLTVLGKNDVNIVALSLADTADYGMLRMIVSDPMKGRMVLKEAGITAMLTDVVAIRVPHATGSLSKAMHALVEAKVNVEYMYAFANGADASAVLNRKKQLMFYGKMDSMCGVRMKRTRQIVKNKECIIVICSLFFGEKTEKYTKYTY